MFVSHFFLTLIVFVLVIFKPLTISCLHNYNLQHGYPAVFFLLSLGMFICREPNNSGTYSVQVISKHNGRYVLEKSFGASSDEAQLKVLEEKASCWMSKYEGQTVIDFTERQRLDDNRLIVEGVLDNIDKVLLNGPLLILDGIYDSIGFGLIVDSAD